MVFEIETKEYSAVLEVRPGPIRPELTVVSVMVSVAGVEVELKDLLPPEVWDALYNLVIKKYEECGGDLEELRARLAKIGEQDDNK